MRNNAIVGSEADPVFSHVGRPRNGDHERRFRSRLQGRRFHRRAPARQESSLLIEQQNDRGEVIHFAPARRIANDAANRELVVGRVRGRATAAAAPDRPQAPAPDAPARPSRRGTARHPTSDAKRDGHGNRHKRCDWQRSRRRRIPGATAHRFELATADRAAPGCLPPRCGRCRLRALPRAPPIGVVPASTRRRTMIGHGRGDGNRNDRERCEGIHCKTCCSSAQPRINIRPRLPQFEFDRDLDNHIDRRALPCRRRESPLLHRLPCAIVESAAQPVQEL